MFIHRWRPAYFPSCLYSPRPTGSSLSLPLFAWKSVWAPYSSVRKSVTQNPYDSNSKSASPSQLSISVSIPTVDSPCNPNCQFPTQFQLSIPPTIPTVRSTCNSTCQFHLHFQLSILLVILLSVSPVILSVTSNHNSNYNSSCQFQRQF